MAGRDWAVREYLKTRWPKPSRYEKRFIIFTTKKHRPSDVFLFLGRKSEGA